jgi:hypothetical protein
MDGQRGDTTWRLGLAFAILAGAAVTLSQAPLALVPPRPCAALPELTTLWLARFAPHLPVAASLTWLNAIVLLVGVAWMTRLVQRVSNTLIGTAVGVAIAAWAVGAPRLEALHGAGPLLAAAVLSPLIAGAPRSHRLALSLSLALVSTMWPSSTLACTVLFVIASRMILPFDRTAVVGAGTIMVTGTLTVLAAAGITSGATAASCLIPGLPSYLAVTGALSTVGPYVTALAALGLFARRHDLSVWLGFAIAVFLLGSSQASLSAAPVAFAVPAACGLAETIRACRTGPGGRLAAALLVALVPVLAWQASAASPAPFPDVHTFGHDQLSLSLTQRLVAALPQGARVVSEDAVGDVLVRAASHDRSAPPLSREANAISAALSKGERVFALPLAQRDLGQLGYRLEDVLPGLAEVHAGAACHLATSEWRSLDNLDGASALTLAARTAAETGPVVIYATLEARPALDTVEWPATALRGFYTTIYDPSSAEDRAHLAQDVVDDGAPAERVGRDGAFVARLELWRTPNAPLRLTVTLGVRPGEVIARVIAKSEPRRLWLCPAYMHAVQRISE